MTPEGVYLNKLEQRDMQVTLSGMAQSNERVAEFLRNLSERSAWLESLSLRNPRERDSHPWQGRRDQART